ncbi:MAG: MFS transporter [Gammaproteobacteria bacterium]
MPLNMTPPGSHPRDQAWLVLALVAVANFGNFYVYDSIGPVADLLERQRGFSDTQIGLLNAIYSLPNIVLLLAGGLLVDRFGAGRVMLATGLICLAGALVTAWAAAFGGMAAGRLLFGIGAETFSLATLAAVVKYFPGRHMALAVGVSLALGRAGAFAVDLSPTWIPSIYAAGWQPPLVVAAQFAALSLAAAAGYWRLDRRRGAPRESAAGTLPLAALGESFRLGRAFWQLFALCLLWYAVIIAFRSTFSIKYFQHVHGLGLAEAGAINGYVFLAALFATPAFGWLCDRIGRYALLLAFGAMLLPLAIATLASGSLPLWIGTVLIGISYSLVPAVLWPLTAQLVPASRLGLALGLMSAALNAGIVAANVAAGRLNDAFDAGPANPAGYEPMMTLFFWCGALGFGFALLQLRPATRGAPPETR